jgi:hypothetical protein
VILTNFESAGGRPSEKAAGHGARGPVECRPC